MDVGVRIREYIKNRKFELNCDKECIESYGARRSVNAAMAELMHVHQFLDEIDPVGAAKFIKQLEKEEDL